jgi:hypothetical protein
VLFYRRESIMAKTPHTNQHEKAAGNAARNAKGSHADAATSRTIALTRTGKMGRMFTPKTFGPGKKFGASGMGLDADIDADSCGYGNLF